jgi:transcriptional regulator with XRE-family HTH domain
MDFAQRLKEARLAAKFPTAKSFCKELNDNLYKDGYAEEMIKENTYTSYESGAREPRLLLLTYMSKILNVSTDSLLGTRSNAEMKELHQIVADTAFANGEQPAYATKSGNMCVYSNLGQLYMVTADDLTSIVDEADQLRLHAITDGIEHLLQEKRQYLRFKENSPLGQTLLWNASFAIENLHYKEFKAAIKPEQYGYEIPDERLNLMTALCYVYYTGLNPTTQTADAQHFTARYSHVRFHEPIPKELNTQACKEKYTYVTKTYLPKKRIPILDAYVAFVNDFDYMKFRDTFTNADDRFRRLQKLFLDYLIKKSYNQGDLVEETKEGIVIRMYHKDFEQYVKDYFKIATPMKQTALEIFMELAKHLTKEQQKQSHVEKERDR